MCKTVNVCSGRGRGVPRRRAFEFMSFKLKARMVPDQDRYGIRRDRELDLTPEQNAVTFREIFGAV